MVTLLDTPVIANPLREGLQAHRTANPCILVLFGITGDLAHRKLLPALYNLYIGHQLGQDFTIVGFARRPYSDEDLRKQAKDLNRKVLAQQTLSTALHLGAVSPRAYFYLSSNF